MEFSGWKLDSSERITPEMRHPVPANAMSYLAEPGAWEQFSNEMVYELDKGFRDWMGDQCRDKRWVRTTRSRRYTFGMLFEILYGRKYDSSRDAKMAIQLSRIFNYYSSKVQKGGSLHGKSYGSKTIYTLSPTRYKKSPPYSLKLRLEWLAEQGKVPNAANMKVPVITKPPFARNPKTEENRKKRSEHYRKLELERRARENGEPDQQRPMEQA